MMATQTQPTALAYHQQQRSELIALAWRLIEDDLQDTRAYRETLAEIARHERLIAALVREFGGSR